LLDLITFRIEPFSAQGRPPSSPRADTVIAVQLSGMSDGRAVGDTTTFDYGDLRDR
jgi:hypothetical protein